MQDTRQTTCPLTYLYVEYSITRRVLLLAVIIIYFPSSWDNGPPFKVHGVHVSVCSSEWEEPDCLTEWVSEYGVCVRVCEWGCVSCWSSSVSTGWRPWLLLLSRLIFGPIGGCRLRVKDGQKHSNMATGNEYVESEWRVLLSGEWIYPRI